MNNMHSKDERREQIRNNIRNNLIRLRQKKGVTQEELGTVIDKSTNAIGSWEQGLSLPTIETCCMLADYYGVSLDFLCSGSPKI